MCYTPQEVLEACVDASGGLEKFAICPQADVEAFGALNSDKKIPTITFEATKKMFEIEFIDEAMSPDGSGGDENDIGTINQPVKEFVGTLTCKAPTAAQRAYFNDLRKGRHIFAMKMNNGQIFIAGSPDKPAYCRKVTSKFGKKLENPVVVDLEFYFKSKAGIQEYAGTWESLFVAGT
jgi:hypothetical protein